MVVEIFWTFVCFSTLYLVYKVHPGSSYLEIRVKVNYNTLIVNIKYFVLGFQTSDNHSIVRQKVSGCRGKKIPKPTKTKLGGPRRIVEWPSRGLRFSLIDSIFKASKYITFEFFSIEFLLV